MGVKKQYYGIKYPFSNQNTDELLIDLNENLNDKVPSDILHVILTPKGSRLRKPEFGTDLIKYIFGKDGQESDWDAIKDEVTNAVSRFVPDTKLEKIDVVNENEEIFIDAVYSVKKGNKEEKYRLVTKI